MNVQFDGQDDRYPYGASAAAAEGVTAAQSYPVLLDGRSIGSFNLYSRSPGGFPVEHSHQGDILASPVAVALEKSKVLAASRRVLDEAQAEPDRRDTLAQAEGVLMALHKCTIDQARHLMENASVTEQRTIADVAALILSTLAAGDIGMLDTTDDDAASQRRDADSD